MRLTKLQIEKIHLTLNQFLTDLKFEIYLYGSRTDDALKGGDIDLLIVTNTIGVDIFKNKKLDILVALKKNPEIGQRKVDIKATTADDLKSDPFLKSISNDMVLV